MNTNKHYTLIAITDKEGNDKSQSKALYMERMNCLATNMRMDKFNRVYVDFIQSAEGKPILRHLHTSKLERVEETENGIILHTRFSRYVFEEAKAPKETFADAAGLLELYLTNEGNKFVKGFYYDKDKNPHKLHLDLHIGTFTDTALIHDPDAPFKDYYCRYYIDPGNTIEFYRMKDWNIPMLIHNVSEKELIIKCEVFSGTHTIKAGENKTITPGGVIGEAIN